MVTLVIPVKNIEANEKKIIENLKDIKVDEIIIVEGNNPSFQRNEAVKNSNSDLIYFLDDDSIPDKLNIKRAEEIFKKSQDIAVVGGPAIQTKFRNFWQRVFSIIFSSLWATGKSRARYTKIGQIRETDEKELILCNMFVKKEIFLKEGGFRDELYPNEENEFLNRIKRKGYKIIYDPEIVVEREHRENFREFIKQCFRYGKGRAEQIFFEFALSDFINFIPAIFVFYIFSLFFVHNIFYFSFLLIYLLLNFLFSLAAIKTIKDIGCFFVLFLCFPLLHILYGTGFIAGVFMKFIGLKKKMDKNIKIKKLELK